MTERTLVLLRHAEADLPNGIADVDRPLTEQGRTAAVAIGRWLAERGLHPSRVLCSAAARTRQTWDGVRTGLADAEPAPDVVIHPLLYRASAREVLDLVRATEPAVAVLLVIGHNPAVSTASALLDPDAATSGGLRPGGLAVHRIPEDWASCLPAQAELAATHTGRAG